MAQFWVFLSQGDHKKRGHGGRGVDDQLPVSTLSNTRKATSAEHTRLAYLGYRASGANRRAALTAAHLSRVEHDGLGNIGTANGWSARPRRLLKNDLCRVRVGDPAPSRLQLAHLATATTGTAVGLLCARPVITGFGWTVLAALIILLATATQPWLPPVGTAVKALSNTAVPITQLTVDAAMGSTLAVLACAISIAVGRRR